MSSIFFLFQINHNGIVTFEDSHTSYSPESFPLDNDNPLVSPFWADIDIRNGHNVDEAAIYYREETADAQMLQRATDEVNDDFGNQINDFEATWLLVVTWHRVTFYGNNGSLDDVPVSLDRLRILNLILAMFNSYDHVCNDKS